MILRSLYQQVLLRYALPGSEPTPLAGLPPMSTDMLLEPDELIRRFNFASDKAFDTAWGTASAPGTISCGMTGINGVLIGTPSAAGTEVLFFRGDRMLAQRAVVKQDDKLSMVTDGTCSAAPVPAQVPAVPLTSLYGGMAGLFGRDGAEPAEATAAALTSRHAVPSIKPQDLACGRMPSYWMADSATTSGPVTSWSLLVFHFTKITVEAQDGKLSRIDCKD
ncbi:hypothetical protein [Yinghuangia soli]|uniref:Uncharacterized protein n=1 Tax=Yinghuangia soli TaxID=2908204 RepID=A0AA41Q5I8_9ACTN|nr:hypothetical protein [Yinghuangia soli]MCF2531365.1 hypothetical protein [Yinghuangia soli]